MRLRAWPVVMVSLGAVAACTNDYETFRFPRQPSTSRPEPDGGITGTSPDAPPGPSPTMTAEPDARPPAAPDARVDGGTVVPEGAAPIPGDSEAGPRDAAFDVTNG